jgi:acetyl-CoA carboxylase carboxyl transferase subunit beta
MNLKNLFKKTKTRKITGEENIKPEVPSGLFVKCDKCGSTISKEEFDDNLSVCPRCSFHMPISAKERIESITDKSSFSEWKFEIKTKNILNSKGYDEKLEKIREKTNLYEAVISGRASIDDRKVAIVVMDSRFMMASMGYYVGEHITKTIEKATEERLPVIIFTASGGARMQEGIVSLMQMAKTAAALKRHHEKGLLYVTVLTHPTTGGVTASFASLGDIILAEPGALIGFAGQRVIESTIKQKLPEGFQSAEFQLKNGFVDKIVERKELRIEIDKILGLHVKTKVNKIYSKIHKDKPVTKKIKEKHTPWEIVNLARDKNRPVATEYINKIFDDFIEFHGDRNFGDDSAIVGGIAKFKGKPVTVIGQAKGTDITTNVARNFGMPSPHGYRKSLRLMKQAEKFGRPIICFVDTPGAYCGITAEEGGRYIVNLKQGGSISPLISECTKI